MVPPTTHSPPREPPTQTDTTLDTTDDETLAADATRSAVNRATLYSIERLLLQTRIAALEQRLQTATQQRVEIIDQYERLLEERTDQTTIDLESDGTDGVLDRLQSLF